VHFFDQSIIATTEKLCKQAIEHESSVLEMGREAGKLPLIYFSVIWGRNPALASRQKAENCNLARVF
jgi:hypothetical protein